MDQADNNPKPQKISRPKSTGIDRPFPIIDVDEDAGTIQKLEKVDGKNYIRTISADLQANQDWNKALQNDGTRGYGKSRDLKHVASVPVHVVELWKKLYGVDVFNKDHEKAVIRLLQDPDLRHFRTDDGKPI